MTIFLVVIGACLLSLGMAWLAHMPRGGFLAVFSALLIGCIAWTISGQPMLAGSPISTDRLSGFGDPLTDPRQGMTSRFGAEAQWLGLSDGMMRMGRTEMAARTLAQGLRRYPRSVDLWVGYGNVLFAHGDGTMSPAAAMAFDRASALDPAHPAPDFFRGLAFAQAGDLEDARRTWQALLDRSPPDAPFRADLSARLAQMRAAQDMQQ